MNGQLFLHCDTKNVTLDDIRNAECPKGTDTWHPIAHANLLDTALDSLQAVGLSVRNERYGLSGDSHRFFGVLDLVSEIADGVSLAVGVRNSTDKSMSAGLVLGSRVFVCDNLAFDAEIKVTRRHTQRISEDLPRLIDEAVFQIPGYTQAAEYRISRMKGFPVDSPASHDIIVRAADDGAINWTDVPKVLKEWREPSHLEFEPRSAWSLYNGFTEVLKKAFGQNPDTATERTVRLSRVFDAVLN
jgi:hypothetical protein